MSKIENSEFFELIARFIRAKRVRWSEWNLILEGQKFEDFTTEDLFEALSAPVNYKVKENVFKRYDYWIAIGGEEFLLIYDRLTELIKVYSPKKGETMDEMKPIITFSTSFLEKMKEELEKCGGTDNGSRSSK